MYTFETLLQEAQAEKHPEELYKKLQRCKRELEEGEKYLFFKKQRRKRLIESLCSKIKRIEQRKMLKEEYQRLNKKNDREIIREGLYEHIRERFTGMHN